MELYFNKRTSAAGDMKRIAEMCVKEEGLDPEKVSISVSFVSKEEIRVLNRDFRDKDAVTDVLSFPQFEKKDLKKLDMPEIEIGDVVICMDRVAEQAKELGHSRKRESMYLFTHSVFHLLGYDHMTEADKKVMRAKEKKIMGMYLLPQLAEEAKKNAFAPFSSFHVGAAVLTKDGTTFTGCNVENSSYGACICAERVAMVKAVSEGHRDFTAIAVTEMPCGICRQFMYEFNPDMTVLVKDKEYKLKELLPEGFRLDIK